MANTPSSNGKGSARRTENLAKVRENWDQIDWSKGRPAKKRPVAKRTDDQFWTKRGVYLHGDPLASDAENDLNEQMQEDDDLRPY